MMREDMADYFARLRAAHAPAQLPPPPVAVAGPPPAPALPDEVVHEQPTGQGKR